jgi:hypothetical protein
MKVLDTLEKLESKISELYGCFSLSFFGKSSIVSISNNCGLVGEVAISGPRKSFLLSLSRYAQCRIPDHITVTKT